jgi:hypothetical protein
MERAMHGTPPKVEKTTVRFSYENSDTHEWAAFSAGLPTICPAAQLLVAAKAIFDKKSGRDSDVPWLLYHDEGPIQLIEELGAIAGEHFVLAIPETWQIHLNDKLEDEDPRESARNFLRENCWRQQWARSELRWKSKAPGESPEDLAAARRQRRRDIR